MQGGGSTGVFEERSVRGGWRAVSNGEGKGGSNDGGESEGAIMLVPWLGGRGGGWSNLLKKMLS